MLKKYINKTIDDYLSNFINNTLNSYENKLYNIKKVIILNDTQLNNEDYLKNEIIKLEDNIKNLNQINLEKTREINVLDKENNSNENIQNINKLEKRYFSLLNDIETIEKNNFFINYLKQYKSNVNINNQEKINKDLNLLLNILEQKFENLNNSVFFKNIPKVNNYISKKTSIDSILDDKLFIEKFISLNKNKVFTTDKFIQITSIFNKFEIIINNELKNNNIKFEDYSSSNTLIDKYIKLLEKEEYYAKKILDKNNKIEKYNENHNFMNILNKYILDNTTPIKLEIYKSNHLLMKEVKDFSIFFKNIGIKEDILETVKNSFKTYEKNIKEKVKNQFEDLKNIHLETFEEKIIEDIDNIFEKINDFKNSNIVDSINENEETIKDNTIFYNKNLEKIEKKEDSFNFDYI